MFRRPYCNVSLKTLLLVALTAPYCAPLSLQTAQHIRPLTGSVERLADLADAAATSDDNTFISKNFVPTFAAGDAWVELDAARTATSKAVADTGAVFIEGALSSSDCEALIDAAESAGFAEFDAGKNTHAAVQIVISEALEAALCARVASHVPATVGADRFAHFLSRRLRFYRYAADGAQTFRPHVDAGFPASTVRGDTLVLDGFDGRFASRFSALFYLNDDFGGGETSFAKGEDREDVRPKQGACLLIPQALEGEMDAAREAWHGHAGLPVAAGSRRPKYVIRTDCMFSLLDPHAPALAEALAPRSPAFDAGFLEKLRPLYSVHMGVENAAPALYALARFVKPSRVVEVGAGYTSLWLLRALADNDAELARVAELQRRKQADLLDWPWCEPVAAARSSLVCVDNCAHQTTTAGGVVATAEALGLADRLEFVEGDAFEIFGREDFGTIDLFWLDFGVGDRVADFVRGLWPSIAAGGFVVCHSTLTNVATRTWLDAVRAGAPEAETGIPAGEVHHVSLLEPHKHFQNALSILQKRPPGFAEPLYSERA